MLNKKVISIIALFGFFSFSVLVYFYFVQRDFTKNQREFVTNLDTLDNYNSDITSELLKNALYAYNSQDTIAHEYDLMQNQLRKLENSNILQHAAYASIKNSIDKSIKNRVNTFLGEIQDFLLLNAAVKNSVVFLSVHVENALTLKKEDRGIYIDAVKILDSFKDTKKTQDLDYIRHMHYLLHSDSKDKRTQKFIKIFNLHSTYLMKKFPDFISVTKKVLNNKIGKLLNEERENFNHIALHDFQFLDLFAFIVFVLLCIYFIFLIYLLIKYYKTHTKFIKAANSLQYSLTHDSLTGLYNRSMFEKDKKELDKPAILLANIDSFKEVNDVYGNDFGNSILKDMSKVMQTYFSSISGTKMYRMGGDEFAVLFENRSSQDVFEIAKKLEYLIANKSCEIDTIEVNVSVSVATNTVKPLLENADFALKLVKKDITQRVLEYNKSLAVKENWKNNIETINIIKSALKEDRVVPYFQAIVNLQTLKIEKYEALVRIVLPSKEVLSPFFFLEIAAKTQYYYEITKVMITKTIQMAKERNACRFSINFSMKDIINEEIISILFALFDANRDVASRIDIELLETEAVVVDDERINRFLEKVHSYGSKVLIDDFGTGYSNFSYFSSLDIDVVKIDASIVSEILTDEKKLHMLKSIHNFTIGMGMQNVAEFVESRELALSLKELGIEYAQGYYFSKPLPKPLDYDTVTL